MKRLRLELGVLAALLASFLTVPLPLPHVVVGTVWVALTAVHVVRRRRLYAALLRCGHWRRVAATTALIASAVVATLSGFAQWAGVAFAQWAGVAVAIPWHAGSSTLLAVLAVAHAARRLWRSRRVRRRHADHIPLSPVRVAER